MQLSKVHITNFRSIDDAGEFSIVGSTCLVGKNEAGKTALLQALEAINPYDESKKSYNKTRDYPRRYLNDYKSRHSDSEAVVASTTWELDAKDIEALETEFGVSCLASNSISVFKPYESEGRTWNIQLNEPKILEHLISQAKLDATEQNKLKNVKSVRELYTTLAQMTEPTDKQSALVTKINSYREQDAVLRAVDILFPRMPKFLYFSHYDRMSGSVQLQKLLQDKQNNTLSEGDSVFLDFLEFSGITPEEISTTQRYEDLRAKVEAASNRITDQIFDYWSQNQNLTINFDIQAGQPQDPHPFNAGTIMHARVNNSLHRMTVPFSERSAGFIWFFSFLVRFSQVQKQKGNVIFLLDEPGLTLHAKAQHDLLRYFKEKLEPSHQVIYTTHSPFMVPVDNLACVRTVEDVVIQSKSGRYESKGTKVRDDVLATDSDTIFPLQGALGYEITQSLFIGKDTLLVEGPSDILYLQAVSAALKALKRTGLDARWVICPSGGVDKVNAFVSLFRGNQLHIVVLTDYAKGQKNKVELLRQSQLLQAGHVFTIADFCTKSEADIEDLFEPDVFVEIINKTYNLPSPHLLTPQTLDDADKSTERQVLKAQAYFRTLPAPIAEFDHFTPANWLIQHPEIFSENIAGLEPTFARFESVFSKLNALLPADTR